MDVTSRRENDCERRVMLAMTSELVIWYRRSLWPWSLKTQIQY